MAGAPLTEPTRVQVFTSREAAETVSLLNQKQKSERSQVNGINGSAENKDVKLGKAAVQVLRKATPEEHAIATHRLRVLSDPEYAKAHPTPDRTVRRWQKFFRVAGDVHGFGLLGLFPRFKDRGNYSERFGPDLLAVVDRIIEEVYCTPTRPNKRHAFEQLRLECERNGFPVPSKSFFNKRLLARSKHKDTLAREGKRAAHKYEFFRAGAPNENHGAFPWDACLTDHTLCDVELVLTETGETCRPWLSLLIDGFSRRVLTFCLTYDAPSYRTLMMLVRNCVKEHNRLPGCIVVDNGREFTSTYFETLTAHYGVMIKRRPPGKARFGSVIERMFGTVNTQFLHALRGNTQNTRNIRQLTKSMNPKEHAVFTFEDLHSMISAFVFDIYDKRPHPTLNCSPAEMFAQGIEISGAREHLRIECDEAFHLMTLPTTQKGTAKIQPGMGVKILGFYYWAAEMRSQKFEGKSVRVKYDPEDLGIAWAYLGSQWVQCRPSRTLNMEGRTEKEIKIATLELRRSKQQFDQRQSSSNKHLAEFLKTSHQNKALQIQQAKDRALRNTRAPQADAVKVAAVISSPATNSEQPLQVTSPPPPPISPTIDYGDF